MSIARFRLGSLFVAALALGVLVAFGWGHAQTGTSHAGTTPDGSISVDCDTSASGVQSDCQYDPGATFKVQVNATEAPSTGYVGFQVLFSWDQAVINYVPAAAGADEALWDECGIPARSPEPPSGDPPQLFGCQAFPFPATPFMDTGPILEFEFTCKDPANSTSPPAGLDPDQSMIVLEPGIPNGSYYVDLNLSPVATTLNNATIRCSELPPASPTPTTDAGAEPTAVVPTSLPVTGANLPSSDGGSNTGLWIAIGVLFAAAATAVTGVAWRRSRA